MIYREKNDEVMTVDPAISSSSFISSSRIKSYRDDGCSSPELDVVSFTPGPQSSSSSADDPNNQKRYFCQRCLNHKLEFPRKGHKPFCRYAMCHCDDCMMVEYRRRLNNQLSQRRLDPEQASVCNKRTEVGKKIRDPKCARCSAHGEKQALRGHKKALCPYLKCGCHFCNLVENRRMLMAKQIKLRRDQQKARKAQQQGGTEIVNDGIPSKSKIIKEKPRGHFCVIPRNIPATKLHILSGATDDVFVRPLAANGERSNSSCSSNSSPMLGNSESPMLIDTQCGLTCSTSTTRDASLLEPDLSTTISPMLLPPSLLYQQLCLRSQQQQQKETLESTFALSLNQNESNNTSHMATGNASIATSLHSALSVTGLSLALPSNASTMLLNGQQLPTLNSLNLLSSTSTATTKTIATTTPFPGTSPQIEPTPTVTTATTMKAIDALRMHDAKKQLAQSLLLANSLTPQASTTSVTPTPLFNSALAAFAAPTSSENNGPNSTVNSALMMNTLLNTSSINDPAKSDGDSGVCSISKVFVERLTAILTNGGANFSNNVISKNITPQNTAQSFSATQSSSPLPTVASTLNGPLAKLLLQYSAAFSDQNDNNVSGRQQRSQQLRGTALLLN